MIFDVIDFPEYNSLTAIILYVFAFFSTVQLFYYWFFFRKMAFYKPKKQLEFYPKVSVVICAHNEYQNIKEFLPLVLEQDYPHFEVILVNDDSDDNSEFLMIDFKAKYPHFKIVNTNRSVTFIRGKKFPLSVGIKTAIHPIVLLTDADCYPASKNWIKEMVAGYQNENIEFSLGYGRYEKRKGFLNLLVRFDTVHTALQYFSAALMRIPYMGVGRNLSYTKDIFIRNKGMISQYMIPFGDDDLFVNKHAKGKNTSVVLNPDAQTISIPPQSFVSWFRQKKRHLATGNKYRFGSKLYTGLYASSSFFFYIFLVWGACLFKNDYFWLIILTTIYTIRLVSQLFIYKKATSKLQERGILFWVPFLDLFFAFFNPIWAFLNVIIKKNKWK